MDSDEKIPDPPPSPSPSPSPSPPPPSRHPAAAGRLPDGSPLPPSNPTSGVSTPPPPPPPSSQRHPTEEEAYPGLIAKILEGLRQAPTPTPPSSSSSRHPPAAEAYPDGIDKILERLCHEYKLPSSLISLDVPPSLLQAAGIGNDAVYFVSTPDEAIAVSHQVKGDTEKKPLQIQFANFMAPCFAPAISSQLSWLSEMEGSSNLREVIVCNPSLLSKKKKVADMLNKHQKMFVGLADRVAREQWQSMELQIEKAFSLKESHAEICHIASRSAHMVEILREIKGSALQALVVTCGGLNCSISRSDAVSIIKNHFSDEVSDDEEEFLNEIKLEFLGYSVEDEHSLLDEDGMLQGETTFDDLLQHVLYIFGHEHLENSVLECCNKASKALEENLDGLLSDAEASGIIRAQADTMGDLLRNPSLIGSDSEVAVNLKYLRFGGGTSDEFSDLGDEEGPEEEEEELGLSSEGLAAARELLGNGGGAAPVAAAAPAGGAVAAAAPPFEEKEEVKGLILSVGSDGGAASVAAATPADGAAAAAAPVEEKKEEWKECDDDMGPL